MASARRINILKGNFMQSMYSSKQVQFTGSFNDLLNQKKKKKTYCFTSVVFFFYLVQQFGTLDKDLLQTVEKHTQVTNTCNTKGI